MVNLQEPCADQLNGSERFVQSHADVADAPPASGDIAIIDWCLAFDAVRARLRSSVGPTHLAQLSPRDPARQVRSQVLQCVEALDQLESTMANYIERTRGLDQALSNASAALAQAQADLGRARDGERAARHLASHDGLTSLPNGPGFRARLAEVVAQAADQSQTFAVLYIDLDGFKAVNDVHGHATGDELLRIVGARLRGAVRADDMVSRLGGDEFACLLWGRAAQPRRAQPAGHGPVRRGVDAVPGWPAQPGRSPQHRHRDVARRRRLGRGPDAMRRRGHVRRQARALRARVLRLEHGLLKNPDSLPPPARGGLGWG